MENKTAFEKLLVSIYNKVGSIRTKDIKKTISSYSLKYKDQRKQKKEERNSIKESEITLEDISNQRKKHIKNILIKTIFIGILIVFATTAFILAFQDNEQKPRPNINTTKIFEGTTNFGNIGEKDYFLEQNVLNEKLNKLWDETKSDKKNTENLILNQTMEINKNLVDTLGQYKKTQDENLEKSLLKVKEDINSKIDSQIDQIEFNISRMQDEIIKIENKPSVQAGGISLENGKIVFPDISKGKEQTVKEIAFKEVTEEEYIEEEIELVINNITSTDNYTSTLEEEIENKFKPFKVDLTKSIARVTLLEGVKAPASNSGLKDPTPVLMIIEDILHTANDTDTDLKGCFLSGSAIGNINTSRVEIFGTSLSCIIVADDGKKYKIEKEFEGKPAWIKGEDGGTGIQGVIVDSSGKVLSQSAAIGFLQGLSNYLQTTATSAQNIVSADGTVTQVQALENSFKVGASQGMTSGFDLIIKKYEEILDGYFPYVDTKGGRTNLTVVFDGKTELEITEYHEPNLQMLRENNLERGYRSENK